MAKANFQNYGVQGKVGNQVYYRTASGKTAVREKVTPKNPRTTMQTLQRVLLAQVGLTYKAFKSICDHSFEGLSMGAKCADRFKKLNLQYLRNRASELNQAGISLAQLYQFTPVGSSKFVPGAAIIAQGSLPQIFAEIGEDELGLTAGMIPVSTNTYQGVCDALRLKRGDQLTFVTVNKINGTYVMEKARIILDPRNVDGSGAAMSTAFVDASGVIQSPNWKNNGNLYLKFDGTKLHFIAEPVNGAVVAAAAVIASRKSGDEWLRSNAQLVISEDNIGSDLCSLWDAISGSYSAAEVDLENEAYLNNAGEGGAQSSNDNTGGGQQSGGNGQQTGGSGSGNGSGSQTTLTAPTIGGTSPFAESTQVTMSGPDGAEIRYTTDGSTPTSASSLYSAAITLSDTATVKAIAIKDGQTSEVTTKVFTKSSTSGDAD
ncbi:MAG: chitobiase/beta-hexosaminidase C-terminal domain-containing protein [Bacteroidaceae bacterium]|nr:chitobiase/beta-hexosaminidase C-terminal domain-containing protein [Bacteroidaceae bacterium]